MALQDLQTLQWGQEEKEEEEEEEEEGLRLGLGLMEERVGAMMAPPRQRLFSQS